MADRFLRIYMNDQLAAGVLWRELARRAERNNASTEVGEALDRVARAIAEDVETFPGLMDRLGLPRSRVKSAAAIAAERVGRLKLNGRLRSYSPLSRFVELDALVIGIEGKKILWQNLRDSAAVTRRLRDVDFDELTARAGRQRDELEPHRRAAGAEAFGGYAA